MDSDDYSIIELNLQDEKSAGNDYLSLDDQEVTKKRTYHLLKCGERLIELHQEFKKEILILGDTGNGKSKFTQWIAGDNSKLISKEVEEGLDEYIIDHINDMSKIIITSETIFPQLVIDEETKVAIYDCPGFNDTRDASNEIATTYFIKKVVDHAESVKLIFVINYPSVRKGVDRHNFMKLVKHVADFVKYIEKFKDSIALVVTKVDNQRDKQGKLVDNSRVIIAVANFLVEIKQYLELELRNGSSRDRPLHEAAVKLISILLIKEEEQFSRIGIFRRPDEPGPLNEISLMQGEKKHIKKLINEKLVFTEKKNADFGYTISDKCKNKIHELVEDINNTIKHSLTKINEAIKEHFAKMVNMILNTINSFADETSPIENLQEVEELSTRLRDGYKEITGLIKIGKNPEELANKIGSVVSNFNIQIMTDDLKEIKNKGRYFNCLQVVSDKPLSILQWDELFKEVVKFLSDSKNSIQAEIDVLVPVICEQIKSDFQIMAKPLQDQFETNIKSLDIKEMLIELTNYQNIVSQMTGNTKMAKNVKELLEIVDGVAHSFIIDLPEHTKLHALQKEKKLKFLKDLSGTAVNSCPSSWTQPFEHLVKYLEESISWYTFLEHLYSKFSDYEIQKNREIYNVSDIADWGKSGKLQGIVVTEGNFPLFLSNIARFNISFYDVKNITLTESRLTELNQLLSLTLKHRLVVQATQSYIAMRDNYVSIKEIVAHLKDNFKNPFELGAYKAVYIFALKKVFIDADISLPGMELSIISPEWEIIGSRKINLDGVDGEAHNYAKAKDGVCLRTHDSIKAKDGEHGKPGLPGNPGGNFFGIGEYFLELANLTVTANGGSGGPGQDGGSGCCGKDGEHIKSLTYKTTDDPPRLVQYIPVKSKDGITRVNGFVCEAVARWSNPGVFLGTLKLFRFSREENTKYIIFGSKGQAGGDGGHGGIGGIGGNAGNISMLYLNKEMEGTLRKENNRGKDGSNGRGGKGGKGGSDGDNGIAVLNGLFKFDWVDNGSLNYEKSGSASKGANGYSGRYDVGLKYPKPSQAISDPFEIIKEYEGHVEQSLKSPFGKAMQLSFITRLKDINEKDDLLKL